MRFPTASEIWRHVKAGLPLLLLATAVNAVLVEMDVYRVLELREFDRLMQTIAARDSGSEAVVLVTIDAEDYDTLFARRSPLDPDEVVAIIAAIAETKPRLLAVDLVTAEWSPALRARIPADLTIVWSAIARHQPDHTLEVGDNLPFGATDTSDICVAFPIFRQDADGVVREVAKTITTADRGVRPTLAYAVQQLRHIETADSFLKNRCRPTIAEDGEGTRIRYTGAARRFRRIAASQVLSTDPQTQAAVKAALGGKIVLLGGTYPEARDQFQTPVGSRDGVEILAHAIESIGAPIVSPTVLAIILEVVLGVLGLAILATIKPPEPLDSVVAVLLPFILALPISYLAFNYYGSFLSVAGGLLGIPVHFFIEKRAEYRATLARMAEANADLERQLRERDAVIAAQESAAPTSVAVTIHSHTQVINLE